MCTAPGFDQDTGALMVEVTAQRGPHVDGAQATLKAARGEQDYRQHFQSALAGQPIMDKESGRQQGVRLVYKGLGLEGHYHWRVRAIHVIDQDGMTVYAPASEQNNQTSGNEINPEEPGWVYKDL